MEYKLKIGDEEKTVDVAIGEAKNSLIIAEDEIKANIQAVPISPNQISLRPENGNSVNAFVARAEDGLWVWINGKVRFVQDADQVSARRSRGTGDAGGPTEVTPQTPSTVVSVMVKAGQHVDKGSPCVVVSAMKMETTLTAPYAGTVESVNTEEGAKCMPGDILVDIKPDEQPEEENE